MAKIQIPPTASYEAARKRLAFCEAKFAEVRAEHLAAGSELAELKDRAVAIELQVHAAYRDADDAAIDRLEAEQAALARQIERKTKITAAKGSSAQDEYARQVLLAEAALVDSWRRWLVDYQHALEAAIVEAAGPMIREAFQVAAQATGIGSLDQYMIGLHKPVQALPVPQVRTPVPLEHPQTAAVVPNEIRYAHTTRTLRVLDPAVDAAFREEWLPAL